MNKKILITTGIFPPDIGGPATYSKTLADGLAKAGFSVKVLTFYSFFKNNSKNSKVFTVWRGWPKGLRHIIYFFRILKLAKKTDVIFSQNATSVGLPALLAARLLKKKLVVKVVIDSLIEVARPMDDAQFRHRLQKFVAQRADLVIVPCQYLKSVVVGWGIKENKVKVIYNGVKIPQNLVSKEKAKETIGIQGNLILSIGRLVPGKGFAMLIKILPELHKTNPHLRLAIVGDGPEMENFEKMIANLRLKNRVFLVGKKKPDELLGYFAAADMFILNSFSEGFSHVILEAMAAGLPVISTATGGTPEIVKNGYNGFLLPKYNDEFGLIETIRILTQNKDIKDKFIKAGLETAEFFSREKMISSTVEVLKI